MSEFLEVHRDNAQALIEESVPLAIEGQLSYADLLELCERYRIFAIASLLLDADPAALHAGLHDGACAFKHGIGRVDRRQIVLSQAAPLFDAIACRHTVLAAEIAASLAAPWQSDVEYQDDYLYYSVARQWVLAGELDAEVGQAVDALAAVASPTEPRLLVWQALRARDAVAFEGALLELLDGHERRYQMLVDRGRLLDEVAATLPFISVEGLALLRIAEATDIELEEDYPFIPSFARGDFTASFSEGAWRRR
ncbi:MAG TPA: Imm49 family immunity protein [Polyangiaceae bacterium]|nr:Imm49 family immunity protein [Polyangiaceae bacterium]